MAKKDTSSAKPSPASGKKGKGRKLKVFRTPIGFHDAYVAAPSRKAALEAWGAESNIFAQGMAEEVTDPKLMEEPLSRPGEVIRRLRGSEDEHVAALGSEDRPSTRPAPASGRGGKTEKAKSRPPKPSRAELDAAEEAIDKADRKQRKAIGEIEQKMERLERERRELQRRHERQRDTLVEERDRARSAYERAMRAWER
jgi:hypothetical protein